MELDELDDSIINWIHQAENSFNGFNPDKNWENSDKQNCDTF